MKKLTTKKLARKLKPLTLSQRKFLEWIVDNKSNTEIITNDGITIWHKTMDGLIQTALIHDKYFTKYSDLLNALCKRYKDEYENKRNE